MDDLLQEFIAETRDTLGALANELVVWENNPEDKERLDSIFRFFHTIKGSCGFLNLPRFERLSHAAEEVLSAVREGNREPSASLVDAVLAVVDRIGDLISVMETGEALPDESDADLIAALIDAPLLADDQVAQANKSGEAASDNGAQTDRAKIRSIRIPLDLIDHLMNGVSDMVLARNEAARCMREIEPGPELDGAFEKLSTCIADLRDAIGQTRMQRIDRIFSPLPRIVRDLATSLGKQVELKTSGNNVELDREMLEMIRDPLTHIIRNSVDHGLETADDRLEAGKPSTGMLSIEARQSGNQILIEISDDGRGINLDALVARAVSARIKTAAEAQNLSDRAKLELIFSAGLSTADKVTAISGRGVGMDVVRSNIEQIGGSIDIENFPGRGLKITMRVPLTLTIMACLTVYAGGQHFAIPRSAVQEILFSDNSNVRITSAGGVESAYIRGVRLPHVSLEDILGLQEVNASGTSKRTIITVSASSQLQYALAVESVMDHEELVVRPGAPLIMADGVYAGTTLPDNGRPMLLLDPVGLAHRARINLKYQTTDKNIDDIESDKKIDDSVGALMFRGRDNRLCAISLGALERVEDIEVEHFSRVAGQTRVMIDGGNSIVRGLPDIPESGTVKLLRLSDGERHIRFAIGEVLDIVRLPAQIEPTTDHDIVAGVAQIGDQLVEVIDTHWIFANFSSGDSSVQRTDRPVCCLAGSNDQWSRNILAPLIRSAGYNVIFETSDSSESDVEPDIYVVNDGSEVEPEPDHGGAKRRVIRLRSTLAESADAPDTIHRYDRDALLAALLFEQQRKVAS